MPLSIYLVLFEFPARDFPNSMAESKPGSQLGILESKIILDWSKCTRDILIVFSKSIMWILDCEFEILRFWTMKNKQNMKDARLWLNSSSNLGISIIPVYYWHSENSIHFCAFPKQGHGFPTSYAVVFLCSVSSSERWLFRLLISWWNCWSLFNFCLFITTWYF